MREDILNQPALWLELELETWLGAGPTWRARLYRHGTIVASETIDYGSEVPKIRTLFEAAGIPVKTFEAGSVERPRHLRGDDR